MKMSKTGLRSSVSVCIGYVITNKMEVIILAFHSRHY